MSNPHTTALFEISLYQRDTGETAQPEAAKNPWKFKTFGFFDVLEFRRMDVPAAAMPSRRGRHERTLIVYGDFDQITAALDATAKGDCYLGIALVKLSREAAHEKFCETMKTLVGRPGDGAILGCLDAPDIVILKTFRGPKPLEALIDWMGAVRSDASLGTRPERKLTMVACSSLPEFIENLAELDPSDPDKPGPDDSRARALVRITDKRNGTGLRKLRKLLTDEKLEHVAKKLHACAGYYDVQGITSVPVAAAVLAAAQDLIASKDIATSTCFIGEQNDSEQEDDTPAQGGPHSPLYPMLHEAEVTITGLLKELGDANSRHGALVDAVETVLENFRQLNGTGFVPGSRLLIWTTLETLRNLATECRDFLKHHKHGPPASVSLFYKRQRNYAEFFRDINDELDRRVSLSLPAYTRFFPCAIEAPLKVVGSLDVASRLVATSFNAYYCREKSKLLQVFSTRPGKPTYFVSASGGESPDDLAPYATMSTTTLSPLMLEHFHLAVYSVFHEVAQCIIKGTNKYPSFTSLVYTHTLVEWVASVSALVALGNNTRQMTSLPQYIRDWAVQFLRDEVGPPVPNEAVPVQYFELKDAPAHSGPMPGLLCSQQDRWIVGHVAPGDASGALRRDAAAADWIEMHLHEEVFLLRWQQELHNHFGVSADVGPSTSPKYKDHLRKCDEDQWTVMRACELTEYLELASLIPFLRAFESDPTEEKAMEAIEVLISDYFVVWKEWAEEPLHLEFARRFVVAIAALRIYRRQRTNPAEASVSAHGTAADEMIQSAVTASAADLIRRITLDSNDPTQKYIDVIWNQLSDTQVAANYPDVRECHPLIVNGMVRYLVRLLHIYDTEGDHVRDTESTSLKVINDFLRSVFAEARVKGPRLPVTTLARLWTCQYRLTCEPKTVEQFSTVANAADSVRDL